MPSTWRSLRPNISGWVGLTSDQAMSRPPGSRSTTEYRRDFLISQLAHMLRHSFAFFYSLTECADNYGDSVAIWAFDWRQFDSVAKKGGNASTHWNLINPQFSP